MLFRSPTQITQPPPPPPSPSPSPSPAVEEQPVVTDDEALYEANFLPDSEDVESYQLYDEVNDGVPEEGTGDNTGTSTLYVQYTGTPANLATMIAACQTARVNVTSVLEVAIMMNPVNHGSIPNPSQPRWAYGTPGGNLFLQTIHEVLGCPYNLHCAAGIRLSSKIFNSPNNITSQSSTGGFINNN